jgi:hypothetical protein
MSGLTAHIVDLDGRQRELAQSVARASRFRFQVLVTGNGETRLVNTKGVQFGTAMLEEPTFSYGVQAVTPLPLGSLPLATAIVTNYQQDKRGLWIGADMAFRVDAYSMKPQLKFWLTFEGVALRSLYNLDK